MLFKTPVIRQTPRLYQLIDLVGRKEEVTASQVNLPVVGWVPARPHSISSIGKRFRLAWMVLTGKADAVIWPGGQ